MSKVYTSKIYLENEYKKKRRTPEDIAKQHGVTVQTIYNYLRKYNLLRK